MNTDIKILITIFIVLCILFIYLTIKIWKSSEPERDRVRQNKEYEIYKKHEHTKTME